MTLLFEMLCIKNYIQQFFNNLPSSQFCKIQSTLEAKNSALGLGKMTIGGPPGISRNWSREHLNVWLIHRAVLSSSSD